MTTSKVTFQRSYINIDGSVGVGTVRFTPVSHRFVNTGVIIQDKPITVTLDGSGLISRQLVYDANGYTIEQTINGVALPPIVLAPAAGATSDFGDGSRTSPSAITVTGTIHDPTDTNETGGIIIKPVLVQQVINGHLMVGSVVAALTSGAISQTLVQCSTGYTGADQIADAATQETYVISGTANSDLGGTAPQVPSAPGSVAATVADTQTVVTWSAPSDPGSSAITGYTVTLNGGASPIVNSVNSSTFTKTVTGLTNGTLYTVSVVATNTAGDSPAGTTQVTPTSAVNKAHPFTAASPWNTPTPANATWTDSALLRNSYSGNYFFLGTSYAWIHWAQAADNLWNVVVPDFKATSWDRNRSATSFQLRAPATLHIDQGSGDFPLIIADPATGESYEFEQIRADATNNVIYSVHDATNGDSGTASATPNATTLTDSGKAWTTNKWNDSVNRHNVVCAAAPNGGCWAPIQSNTGTVLTVTKWIQIGTASTTYADGSGNAFPPNATTYEISGLPSWAHNNMVTGTGVGANDGNNPGVHASNAALSGGLLTGADWAAGTIAHALVLTLNLNQLKGGNYPVTSGFVAPATAGEPFGVATTGAVLLGAKIGIPAGSVMPTILGTTQTNGKLVGKMVWDALKTYGGFAMDVTFASSLIYADGNSLPAGNWDGICDWWNSRYGTNLSAMDVIKPFLRIAS